MDYKGMSVNERLYASGLIDQFDVAVKNRDIKTIKRILAFVNLPEQAIKEILEAVLNK